MMTNLKLFIQDKNFWYFVSWTCAQVLTSIHLGERKNQFFFVKVNTDDVTDVTSFVAAVDTIIIIRICPRMVLIITKFEYNNYEICKFKRFI